MKKLLLLSAVLIFSLKSFSQDIYSIKSVTIGKINDYTEKCVWGEYLDADLTLTIKNNIVFISDAAKSVYILGGKVLDKTDVKGIKQVAWKAKDEGDRSCTVKIATYPSGVQMIYVIYSDRAFGYTIEH